VPEFALPRSPLLGWRRETKAQIYNLDRLVGVTESIELPMQAMKLLNRLGSENGVTTKVKFVALVEVTDVEAALRLDLVAGNVFPGKLSAALLFKFREHSFERRRIVGAPPVRRPGTTRARWPSWLTRMEKGPAGTPSST